MDKIKNDIEAIDMYFRTMYPDVSFNERLLSRSVKLSEEVGEVSEAVLSLLGHQRTEKEATDLGNEIADVIISALVLAKTSDIDVWAEVEKKLTVVKERYSLSKN